MTLPRAARLVIGILGALLLLGVAWIGISGGVGQWSDESTPAQRLQSASQVVFGAFALFAIVTVFMWRQWSRITDAGFVVACAISAGLASVVWGGTSLSKGVVSGLGALLVAALFIWMLRVGASSLRATVGMEE